MDEQAARGYIKETLSELEAWAKRFNDLLREAQANAVQEIGSRARSVLKQIDRSVVHPS